MVKGGNRLDDIKAAFGDRSNYSFKEKKYTGDFLRNKDGDLILDGKDPIKAINTDNYALAGLNINELKEFKKMSPEKKQQFILENKDIKRKYKTEYTKGHPIRTKTVLVLFLLAIFYVILAIVAAEIYNQSGNKMKDDTRNQNSYTYIITSMTVAITIVITLLLGAIADKYRLALFLLIFGIFGTATCGIGIQWLNNSDTLSEKYVKGRKIFMGVGIGFWILVFFSGIFTAFSKP